MILVKRLEDLGLIITEICNISALAGMSLGVLHQGEIIHHANFGYRDVVAQLPPNENTSYVLGSLTKAFTSAMVGMLVEDGELDWTTHLRNVLPEFHRDEKDSTSNITMLDLLSHRTGLAAYDGLWLLSGNDVAFERSQAVPILNYLPVARPFRTEFLYNNFAYEVAGQVIEKVSGTKYATFLQDRILEPLGMTRTFYTNLPNDTENIAKPYASLKNTSVVELPPPLHGEDVIIGAAGGIRSSVNDLLLFYKAFIDAGNSQIENAGQFDSGNPLKQLPRLWNQMITLPFPSLREHSYALGWVRAQLPSIVGLEGPSQNDAENLVVGQDRPSRLILYHQGNIPGYITFTALIPETSSAVVVLSNSQGLSEGSKLVGNMLIEAILGSTVNPNEYLTIAKASAKAGASAMSDIMEKVEQGRTVLAPVYPLHEYTGRYYNSIGNYFIDILKEGDKLLISFMGLESNTFGLEPYQDDSFFWQMTHDECAMRGRITGFPLEYYIIRFGCSNRTMVRNRNMNCLQWKFDADSPGNGEAFRKSHKSISPLRTQLGSHTPISLLISEYGFAES